MNIHLEAGIEAIREKSLKLTEYLMELIDSRLVPYGYQVGNPRAAEKRGGHVALEHPEAWRICQALKERGVIPDFREPNVIRLAPVALYTSFEDLLHVADVLEEIARDRIYEKYSDARALVV